MQQAKANELDNFELVMKSKLEGMMIDRMDRNQELVTKCLNEPAFREVFERLVSRKLYEDIRSAASITKGWWKGGPMRFS